MSPLTVRILAVNLIAPMMLLAGLMYIDKYERALVRAEFEALRIHADLLAAAVGEGAVSAQTAIFQTSQIPVTSHQLVPETARSMVRRLAQLAGVRARLFNGNGILVADSSRLMGPGGTVEVTDIAPISPHSITTWLKRGYEVLNRLFHVSAPVPFYVENRDQTASDYPEVVAALENGNASVWMRRLDHDHRLLMAAVPVTFYKQVVGAVMVTRTDSTIQDTLIEVRATILRIFLSTLAVTILLSLYLAQAIARPIRRLAHASERVRKVKNRRATIPDLSWRGDEIGELSLSLRDMTDTLWQRMDATERFAADVSHEIKNPLTSLRSAVETLALVRDPTKQQRLLAILKDDVARLDRLITDISSASRLDAELSRAEMAEVPIRPMLETLRDVYAPVGEERKVSVLARAPNDDTLSVLGVEDRLVQVVRNLIGNALSFSPAEGTLVLSGRREDDKIILTVDDDGPGIPEGKEEAIFDRFYTERPQGEKFGSHSGLGLSISKQIVSAHRGTIIATNRTNADGSVAGARFIVTLPSY